MSQLADMLFAGVEAAAGMVAEGAKVLDKGIETVVDMGLAGIANGINAVPEIVYDTAGPQGAGELASALHTGSAYVQYGSNSVEGNDAPANDAPAVDGPAIEAAPQVELPMDQGMGWER